MPALDDVRRILWTLPVVFVIHDGEELLTMPAWIAAHGPQLARMAQSSAAARRAVASLATTTPAVAVAIGAVFAVVLAVTVGATRSVGRGFWWHAYAAVLGVLFLHVYTHVFQAVLVGGYVPGLYGAVFAVLPGGAYLYRRLFRAGVLTLRAAAVDAVIGVAVALPGVLGAHALGRLVGR
jgi:hypothetical protein